MSTGGSLEDRQKKLALTLKNINKDYGSGAVGKYSDMPKIDVETVSTGSLMLDSALGVGGLPRGRIVEIYGPEASGKTTLTLHAIAECQKAGGIAAFIDAEHALDPIYAQNLGVDMENLILSQPDSGEQALDIALGLAESGTLDIIVIDSVAALVPKAEIEGEMGDMQVGLQARLMSKACRKLSGTISKTKTILVFINQTRSKIGIAYGSPETTSGGNALKFYASQRIDIRRSGTVKKGEDSIASRTKCKIVKNKVAPPFKVCEFDITFGKGINKTGEIVDAAIALALIEKAGTWYKYEGETIAQGRDSVVDYLNENTELKDNLEQIIRKQYGLVKDE